MFECVPNFSEGRDARVVDALANAVTNSDARLLHKTSDADHNRTVLTFAGNERSILEAAYAAVKVAAERIDLTAHTGVHPRTGAADVIPFVPLEGSTMGDATGLAHDLGERVWSELKIPVYFYEAAAHRPECVRLENIRRDIRSLQPDVGDAPHATAGVAIIGARKVLIAWNINLRTNDLQVAKEIAAAIRESSGGFPAVKALGLALPQRYQVQVSMNSVDYERTPLQPVFNRVAEICSEKKIEVEGAELIGLMPQAAFTASIPWLNVTEESIIENRLLQK